MRVASKLLLSYLVMILLVGALLAILLPQVVSRELIAQNKATLTRQGEVLAIRIATYQLDTLKGQRDSIAQLTYALALLPTNRMFVVDLTGTIIAAEKGSPLIGAQFPRPQVLQKVLKSGLSDTQVDPWQNSLFSRRKAAKASDTEAVWAIVPIKDPRNKANILGAVVAVRPLVEVREASSLVVRALWYWVSGALLVGLVASALISRGLVTSLARLGRAARSVAEGNLSQRVETSGGDEVAELGAHFNHMAERNEALVEGLRKSEALRRELVAAVSHELRTPITSIQGFSEALRDGLVKEPEQQERYLRVIAEEATRLARLVEDLFEVSKLEAGQGEFRFTTVPVTGWLEKFADRTRPRLEQDGLRLVVTLPPAAEDTMVVADLGRLDQVLTNLVNNAARFAPAGTPVEVRVEPGQGGVTIAVHNRGSVIPPDEQARVFQRFYQGRQNRPHKGAGLGLTIVKTIVEAHGGQVGVQSAHDLGTTFWFTLRSAT